jgi:hypothetical protein
MIERGAELTATNEIPLEGGIVEERGIATNVNSSHGKRIMEYCGEAWLVG